MKEGKADYLLLAGGLGKYPPTEASLMKQLALEEGIPESKIILEDEGATTITSITRCARIMRSGHWNSAIVVSDSYHLFRSTLLFRLLGINAIGSEAKGGKEANSTLKWWYYHLRELVALPWTLMVALLKKYNGRKGMTDRIPESPQLAGLGGCCVIPRSAELSRNRCTIHPVLRR